MEENIIRKLIQIIYKYNPKADFDDPITLFDLIQIFESLIKNECKHENKAKFTWTIKNNNVFDFVFCKDCKEVLKMFLTNESFNEVQNKINKE